MPGRLSQERLDLARRLLDDGASYCEAARTIKACQYNLMKRLPGYRKVPPSECGQRAAMARQLNQLKHL